MPDLHYALTNAEQFLDSEKLLYVSSSHYGEDWTSLYHSHSFTEIFYVASGEGSIFIQEEEIAIQKDMLVIINPHISHTEVSSPSNPLNYIVLGIDNLRFDLPLNYRVVNCREHSRILLPLFRSLLNELEMRQESYELICHHFLAVLTLNISRITGISFSTLAPGTTPQECEKAKQYMDTNYAQNITLDTLARLVHWDRFYFSHMFANSYGISPISYLLERRILHSKDLLKHTRLSVTQIAQATGFSSQNYFSQMFKKNTGLTPLQYRKSALSR